MIKTMLILLTALFSTFSSAQNFEEHTSIDEIQGIWRLDSILTPNNLLVPEGTDYVLSISEQSIRYIRGVNTCAVAIDLTKDSISYHPHSVMCTEICCDDRVGNLSNILYFEGVYQVMDSVELVIKNDSGSYFMSKLDPKYNINWKL